MRLRRCVFEVLCPAFRDEHEGGTVRQGDDVTHSDMRQINAVQRRGILPDQTNVHGYTPLGKCQLGHPPKSKD
jgi:hypothetical protein